MWPSASVGPGALYDEPAVVVFRAVHRSPCVFCHLFRADEVEERHFEYLFPPVRMEGSHTAVSQHESDPPEVVSVAGLPVAAALHSGRLKKMDIVEIIHILSEIA